MNRISTRIAQILTVLTLATVVVVPGVSAQSLDGSGSVPASLVFEAGTSLALSVRNISNGAVTDTVTFGPVTAGQSHALANQYIQISYSSNFANYKIFTYTDNGYSDGTFWGALVGNDTSHKAAIKWYVADDTSGALAFNASTADTYTWYKDQGDPDWDTAHNGGYTTITYGAGGGFNNLANGTPASSPIVEYVGAMTAGLVPDVYKTRIYYDLVHI
jgi:hypothetical protein